MSLIIENVETTNQGTTSAFYPTYKNRKYKLKKATIRAMYPELAPQALLDAIANKKIILRGKSIPFDKVCLKVNYASPDKVNTPEPLAPAVGMDLPNLFAEDDAAEGGQNSSAEISADEMDF